MQRSNSIRWAIACLSGFITLVLTAGCGHHTASGVPMPVTTAAVPTATPPAALNGTPAAFQPYTLLPSLPPAPPVATPRHRILHLTRVHNRVYLADSERHLYEAGRDTRGHVYPIYRDPATRVTYPLYYDPARDNLYRLARQQDGHFYRNYVGQAAEDFYDTDRDYERIIPNDADRPIVTDSYNTYNYNTYNDGPNTGRHYANAPGYHPYSVGYRPPVRRANHFNDNWLWAIPVIVGAYLLLQPHHHSPPHPVYNRPNKVVVNQITRINIVNQITQAAPVGYRPLASPRPVYIYPRGYTPQTGYGRPDVRPHGPLGPVMAAPVSVAAVRAAAIRAGTITHPVPNARPTSFAARPVPQALASRPAAPPRPLLRPFVRQAQQSAPVSVPRRQVQIVTQPRSAVLSAERPAMRHAEFARPRVMTQRRQVRALERPRPERVRVVPPPVPEVLTPRPIEHAHPKEQPHRARHPSSVVQSVVLAHPRVLTAPRREETHTAPRVEHTLIHSTSRIVPPIAAPRRSEPSYPAVRARIVRAVTPAKRHPNPTIKREGSPKKEDKSKDAAKPKL